MTTQIDLNHYRKDARGNLIPIENIKDIDLARDELVHELIAKIMPLQEALKNTKLDAMADVNAFVDMSVEQYGVKRSRKGNINLTSFDGKYRVQMACQDVLHFDERLQAAKTLIDECLEEFSEGSRPELKTIVQAAFDVNKEGKISVQKVLGLRRLKIEHEKWLMAMQALNDSLNVQTSREYIRFYRRREDTGEYELINLDMAKV